MVGKKGLPEEPVTETMKSGYPGSIGARIPGKELRHSGPHFFRGLISKGNG